MGAGRQGEPLRKNFEAHPTRLHTSPEDPRPLQCRNETVWASVGLGCVGAPQSGQGGCLGGQRSKERARQFEERGLFVRRVVWCCQKGRPGAPVPTGAGARRLMQAVKIYCARYRGGKRVCKGWWPLPQRKPEDPAIESNSSLCGRREAGRAPFLKPPRHQGGLNARQPPHRPQPPNAQADDTLHPHHLLPTMRSHQASAAAPCR